MQPSVWPGVASTLSSTALPTYSRQQDARWMWWQLLQCAKTTAAMIQPTENYTINTCGTQRTFSLCPLSLPVQLMRTGLNKRQFGGLKQKIWRPPTKH